jgi:hypothetical protein
VVNSTSSEATIRAALATRAYRAGVVRLIDRDLSGCNHLVATRHGLFATDGRALRRIAHGFFYGITVRDDTIFVFEAGDWPRSPTRRGRIVRFRVRSNRIVASDIIATGLDNGCHQIDLIDDRLCVLDTYHQRVLRFAADGGARDEIYPLGTARDGDWEGGYAHANSLIAYDDTILLLLHNGADRTGRASAIARLTRDWQLVDRMPVDGLGCHGLALLEDGAVLTCGSFAGELVATDGLKVAVGAMMTRGLSVGADGIVVGGSAFAERSARDTAGGALVFLDRTYRRLAQIAVPGPVTEVRRIDGQDRSLSPYLADLTKMKSA